MADISSKSHLMFQFLPVLFLSCLISMLCFDAVHLFFSCKCRFPHIACTPTEKGRFIGIP